MSAESFTDMLEQLFEEFESSSLDLGEIERIMQSSAHDLDGQVPVGARLQMIERLARHRLAERVASAR